MITFSVLFFFLSLLLASLTLSKRFEEDTKELFATASNRFMNYSGLAITLKIFIYFAENFF